MYKNKCIIQIGSFVGHSINDPIFNKIDETTKLVLVEPVPKFFDMLKYNYKNKLKDTSNIVFINKAVCDFIGETDMYIPSDKNDFSKLPFWVAQVSSMNSNHIRHINECNWDIKSEKIKVEVTTLNKIVEELNIREIELLHIDAEGYDYDIIMDYNFKIKPNKILFENCHMDGFFKKGYRYDKLIKMLISLGYIKKFENSEDTMFELM